MNKKEVLSCLLAVVMLLSSLAVSGRAAVSAAPKQTVRSIRLLISGRNVTKKTYEMEAGSKSSVVIRTNPKAAVKSAAFKSSNTNVARISKKGRITAIGRGTARITVTIAGKYKKKTAWMNISVKDKPDNTEVPVIPDAPIQTPDTNSQRTLIVYFSQSGNTEQFAQDIHTVTGGDMEKIVPVNAYPAVYEELAEYTRQERDQNARPQFQNLAYDPHDYDVIFIGYPIWWYTLPMIMQTFFETYDLSGKTIIPFNTHEGSGNGGTFRTIQQLEPNAQVLDGLAVRGEDIGTSTAKTNIENWLRELGYPRS